MLRYFSENNPYPPSFSERGKLRLGKKSDLLKCLIQKPDTESRCIVETQNVAAETDPTAFVTETESATEVLDFQNLSTGFHYSISQIPASETLDPPSIFYTKILDGTAVLHFLSPAGYSTFDEFAEYVFSTIHRKSIGKH